MVKRFNFSNIAVFRNCKEVPKIIELVQGVLQQQLTYIKHDPYANAFNKEATNQHYSDDISNVSISPWVWERKFEIDSLCAPLFLQLLYIRK